MGAAGIIAEYNPFHKGHRHHLDLTRSRTGCDALIVVMSGDFVQRGAPAMMDKHERTAMALKGGADLVLELPAPYAAASAERFASAGIEILDRLGIVDTVSFGCECEDPSLLLQAADLLLTEDPAREEAISRRLQAGETYASARLAELPESICRLLSSPNNILAVEYCKALRRRNSSMKILPIVRTGSGYHGELSPEEFPSASGIRALCRQDPSGLAECLKPYLDDPGDADLIAALVQKNALMNENDFSLLLKEKLLTSTMDSLQCFPEISKDLADRLFRLRYDLSELSDFISLVKTRNYTYTRISRCLTQLLLGIHEYPSIDQVRVLGFRKNAAHLLSEISRHGNLPLVTSLAGSSLTDRELYPDLLYDLVRSKKTGEAMIPEASKNMVIL